MRLISMTLKKLLLRLGITTLLMSVCAPLAANSSTMGAVPKQFYGAPSNPVSVQFHDYYWELPGICNIQVPEGGVLYGCYTPDTKTIHVLNPCWYPEAKDNGSFAYITCHEKAHVNGWVH